MLLSRLTGHYIIRLATYSYGAPIPVLRADSAAVQERGVDDAVIKLDSGNAVAEFPVNGGSQYKDDESVNGGLEPRGFSLLPQLKKIDDYEAAYKEAPIFNDVPIGGVLSDSLRTFKPNTDQRPLALLDYEHLLADVAKSRKPPKDARQLQAMSLLLAWKRKQKFPEKVRK